MKVVEKFVSINGEGTRAGELAVFIRFKGCNLACSYCDTMWANERDCPFTEMSQEEILDYVKSTGVKNVTLTGGEPLLQEGVDKLIDLLLDSGHRVEIETNGAVDLKPFIKPANFDSKNGADMSGSEGSGRIPFSKSHRPVFTMDYKLPGSRCEIRMIHSNFDLLGEQDTVKFVSGSFEDMERAKSIIETYDLTNRCHVYLSPVFGSIEPVDMVDFMIKNNMNDVRLQIQLHKVIWDPNKRGV